MANCYEYAFAEALLRRCQMAGIKIKMPEGAFAVRCEVDFESMNEEDQAKCQRLMDAAVEEIVQIEPWMVQSETAAITLEATPVMVNRDLTFRNNIFEIGFTSCPVGKQLVTLHPLREGFFQRLVGHDAVDDVQGQEFFQLLERVEGIPWNTLNSDKMIILHSVAEWLKNRLLAISAEYSDIPKNLISNLFIGQSIYEIVPDLHDNSVSIEACNPDCPDRPYFTPYPEKILDIRPKRQKSGKILPHAMEIVMDEGWAISFRMGTCKPTAGKLGISMIAQLTGMPYGIWRKLIRI